MRRIRSVVLSLLMLVLVVAPSSLAATPAASPAVGQTKWWQGTACYELFVRSFADSNGDGIGDLQGVISKLDYLNDGHPGSGSDLGVGCIWLMPIFASPSYHGYDVSDYRTVNPQYGTNDDMRALLKAAHARGIHVILDLPVNHTSTEHPWFKDAISGANAAHRDWYIFQPTDPGYGGPWGETVWHKTPGAQDYYYGVFDTSMPDLNFRNPDVVKAIDDVATFWVQDMGVDGFRMDAVKHIIEDGKVQENTPETIAWIKHFDDHVHELNPNAFTVGEVMGASPEGLKSYYPDTLDAYFNFPLAQSTVYTARFGTTRKLSASLNETTSNIPDQRWGTFLSNHDQERVASQIGDDPAKLRVGAMLLLTLPGTPFMYYGEEIGLPGNKPDEQIRTPMAWTSDPNAGFTTGTPWEPLQDGWQKRNVAAETNDPGSVLASYRTFGALRETHPALSTGLYTPLETTSPNVLAFMRSTSDETIVVVINLKASQSKPESLSLPSGVSGSTRELVTNSAGPTIDSGRLGVPALPGSSAAVYLVKH